METDWLDLTKQAYDASTSYIDQNLRSEWDYSIKAFRSEHAAGSRYNTGDYKLRSRIFRPKTRSVIRKNEAAAAVALFSNMDVVDVQPGNPDDVMSVASAQCMKEILEYRLTKTIPAFQIVMGGVQDAQKQGVVCSYNYWEYQKKGEKKVKDKPCIELRPIENLRYDRAASWFDPVNTSPYWCDIVPMFVCDVKAMMASKDDKTGAAKWKSLKDDVIIRAKPDAMDTTRKAREGFKQNPEDTSQSIKAFDIVWVMRWCMKDSQGDDYCYYTLGTEELLTDPKPIEEVYFHGLRPYTLGVAIIDTHTANPTSMPGMIRGLQEEANHLSNTRLDNVYLALYKRYVVARGRQVDVNALVRAAPGAVVMASDPKNDIVQFDWNDVTSSAYVEQDRIDAGIDDVAGNFSPNTRLANKGMNDTLGGSRLASQGAGIMSDYLLRTIIETWWEPTLRQLVRLEQYYETDEVVLSVCANKAQLFPRYGISRVTDMMLMNEVNVTVNVGMGASNPTERFTKLIQGTRAVMETIAQAPPNFNVQEFIKEAYSNMGYRDGTRFWPGDVDPRLAQAMKMVQQLQGQLQGKQMEMQANMQLEAGKIQSNERINAAKIDVDTQRIQGDLAIRQAEVSIEQQRLELENLKIYIQAQGAGDDIQMRAEEIRPKIEEAQVKLRSEKVKLEAAAIKAQQDLQQSQLEHEKKLLEITLQREKIRNQERAKQVADGVSDSMGGVAKEISTLKSDLAELNKGLSAMFGLVTQQQKKKVKSMTLRKNGKKTEGVVITYDDGSREDMSVN